MATRYFIANDKQIAKAQQKDYWEKILGHPKLPGDTTEFLCEVLDHPTNNTAMVIVRDADYNMLVPKLTQSEKNALDNALKPPDDPAIVQWFNEYNAAHPPVP